MIMIPFVFFIVKSALLKTFLKVFLATVSEAQSSEKPCYATPLVPVCSNPIFNKHAENLKINEISDNEATVAGNKKIIILTEKLPKSEDIVVRFSDGLGWQYCGCLDSGHLYKQVAIIMKVPKYGDQGIQERRKVSIQLVKISDNSASEPVDFYYTPLYIPGKGKHSEACHKDFLAETSEFKHIPKEWNIEVEQKKEVFLNYRTSEGTQKLEQHCDAAGVPVCMNLVDVGHQEEAISKK